LGLAAEADSTAPGSVWRISLSGETARDPGHHFREPLEVLQRLLARLSFKAVVIEKGVVGAVEIRVGHRPMMR
jgi:hypothetical protein